MSAPRLVVVDDHPLLAAALSAELGRHGAEVEPVAPVGDLDELARAIADRAPSCAVVDLGLPLPGGGEALAARLTGLAVPVVVLTGETDRRRWVGAWEAGARVVLSKVEDLGEIVETVLRVAAGEDVRPHQRNELADEHRRLDTDRRRRLEPFDGLTAREREVLAGLMEGHGPGDLAERDIVSVKTVRTQVKRVLRKLGVGSQLEAVALAHRSGWSNDRLTT